MVGTATQLELDVSAYWGGEARVYTLDPALDDVTRIAVCDRTPLAGIQTFAVDGLPAEVNSSDSRNTINAAIEVFAVNADGYYEGQSLTALRQLVSLRRYDEGIDFTEVLSRLGYAITEET